MSGGNHVQCRGGAGEELFVAVDVGFDALLDVGHHDADDAARGEHAPDFGEQLPDCSRMKEVLEEVGKEHVTRAAIGSGRPQFKLIASGAG